MAAVTEPAATRASRRDGRPSDEVALNLLASLGVALVVGAGLAGAARAGAVALLVATAVVQALVALAWIFGTSVPGRNGAIILAAMASAAADVTVSVWPHGRLGALLAVFGLAVPAMFVHQLARSAARVRVADSLGGIAFLVLAVVSLPAFIQLRHEFSADSTGGKVVAGVVAAAAAGLVVGYLVDMVLPAPRFDPTVPRGLLAVLASAGLGAAVGHLAMHSGSGLLNGRAAFVGAAAGALVGLFAVAVAFVERSVAMPGAAFGRAVRPMLSATIPVALLAPVAFLLCLAVRA